MERFRSLKANFSCKKFSGGRFTGVSGKSTSSIAKGITGGFIGAQAARTVGRESSIVFTNSRYYYFGSRYYSYHSGSRSYPYPYSHRNCSFSTNESDFQSEFQFNYEDDGEKVDKIFFECEEKYECCELDCCFWDGNQNVFNLVLSLLAGLGLGAICFAAILGLLIRWIKKRKILRTKPMPKNCGKIFVENQNCGKNFVENQNFDKNFNQMTHVQYPVTPGYGNYS